ncbi:hypothetical protein OHS18_48430 [Amycolatopsis sp. NBC_00355]|uniref:hypothetical protein n=1 Tax=Amycolatopsis sp. NBC_00355 TaxID=2975957 RepID=UPI002E25AED4
MLAGFPPPLTPPDRPLPPELAGSSSHGYNCRCVATYFGLNPARYGELPACSLTEAEYHGLLVEAVDVQGEAKRLAAARDVTGAQRQYARMRQLAHRLDRTDLELAAVSDLATVCYSAGDLRNARQCAEAVLTVFAVITKAIVHFGQYVELRMIEGSREVAERVLISLSTEDGDVSRARELLADQRRRALFRKAAEPGQFPREQLDPHGADELELRILEVRVQIAAGDPAGARTALEEILAALAAIADVGEVRDQVVSLQAMARAERARVRQAGGEEEDAAADLLRLSARHGGPTAAKFDVQLAETRALDGDFPGAIAAIVAARDELAAVGLTGDVAEASHALGTLLLLAGDVAQARAQFEHAGKLWTANGDTPGARRLDLALARCAAAEGDWPAAKAHAARAQESARASGEWLECLRADFVTATIEYTRGDDLRAALELLLPVALAAQEYRFEFASPEARTAWASGVAGPATALLMTLLTQLGETRLTAELIERACAVGAYTEDRTLDLTGKVPTLDRLTAAGAEPESLAVARERAAAVGGSERPEQLAAARGSDRPESLEPVAAGGGLEGVGARESFAVAGGSDRPEPLEPLEPVAAGGGLEGVGVRESFAVAGGSDRPESLEPLEPVAAGGGLEGVGVRESLAVAGGSDRPESLEPVAAVGGLEGVGARESLAVAGGSDRSEPPERAAAGGGLERAGVRESFAVAGGSGRPEQLAAARGSDRPESLEPVAAGGGLERAGARESLAVAGDSDRSEPLDPATAAGGQERAEARELAVAGGSPLTVHARASARAAGESLPLAALGAVTAALPLRLAPPPDLRWSPGRPMELDRWLGLAAERYHLRRQATETVATWPAATPERETFVLRFTDAGHTFLSWRTTEDLDTVHTHAVNAELVETARGYLAAASPTPHEGESVADAVRRSLADDALGGAAGEQRLARVLALNLLPADLVGELRRAAAAGRRRPLLRVQPSPGLAAVPWGLLALPDRRPARGTVDEIGSCFDGDDRVLDLADVALLAPAGIPRRPSAPDGPPAYLLDPRIPGQSAFGELGSVLGKQHESSPLIRHLDAQLEAGPVRPSAAKGLELVRRTDTDRRLLAELLSGPCSRLVFVGHVSRVRDDHGAQTALHLSCAAELPGTAAPIGAHRPFTAADLALSRVDTMPARVALIGCASASDFGLAEPFGVLLAAVAAGAGLVAATVWALPTSAAVPGADPMAELVVAVDTALAGDDPVTELCAWQRTRLARWRERPEPARSPAFWAALTCLDAAADGQTWVR